MNTDIKRFNLKKETNIRELLKENAKNDGIECLRLMNAFIQAEPNNATVHLKNIGIIEDDFAKIEGAFIDDPKELEKYYRNEIAKNNGNWPSYLVDDVLRSLRGQNSSLYCEALEQKYAVEPGYELALTVSNNYLKLADITKSNSDYSKALKYYQMIFEYDEYKSKTGYNKARNSVHFATLLLKLNRRNDAYKYCANAIELSADYPRSYAVIAQMVAEYPLKNREQIAFYARFIVAHDYCMKALEKVKFLKGADENLQTDIDEPTLNSIIASYKANFLPIDFAFNRGVKDGDDYTLSLPFHKFPVKLRIAK